MKPLQINVYQDSFKRNYIIEKLYLLMTNGILNYYQFITVNGIIQNSQGVNVAIRGVEV